MIKTVEFYFSHLESIDDPDEAMRVCNMARSSPTQDSQEITCLEQVCLAAIERGLEMRSRMINNKEKEKEYASAFRKRKAACISLANKL